MYQAPVYYANIESKALNAAEEMWQGRIQLDIFPPSSESRTLFDSLPMLGAIPLDLSTAVSGDKGRPVVISMQESSVSTAFDSIAEQVAYNLLAKEKTLNTLMPESKEDSEAPKGDLSNDERED